MPLLWAVPNLDHEKCVLVHALLYLRDFLRTPPTILKISQTVVRSPIVIPLFIVLGFFGGSRDQFPGASSSLRSDAGIGGVLDDVLDESCGGDVEDELDNPGTTIGTKYSVLQ